MSRANIFRLIAFIFAALSTATGLVFDFDDTVRLFSKATVFLLVFMVFEWLTVYWRRRDSEYPESGLPSRPLAAFTDWSWLLSLVALCLSGWFVRDFGWDDWGCGMRWYAAAITIPLLWKSVGMDYHFVWARPLLPERAVVFALWTAMLLHPAFCGPFTLAAHALYPRMGFPLELRRRHRSGGRLRRSAAAWRQGPTITGRRWEPVGVEV